MRSQSLATSLRPLGKATKSYQLVGKPARLSEKSAATATTHRYFSSTHRTSSAALQNILASEDDPVRIQVDKLTPRGFHLTDDLLVPGGLMLIDGKPFLWDVNPPNLKAATLPEFWKGLTADAFKIFEVVLPRPEILLFGTGSSVVPPPKEVRDYISGLGIQLDTMDSRNASATFNMLQEEGRRVALAMCPVNPVEPRTGEPRSI